MSRPSPPAAAAAMPALRIRTVEALPVSMPLPADWSLRAGPFTFKGARSTVFVKVTTDDGLEGWGEAMGAGSPRAIARLVNGHLAPLVTGLDAAAVRSVAQAVEQRFLRTSGPDAAMVIAASGLDLALWDLRGKAVGWPLVRLLGGSPRPICAYAGGLSLGFGEPAALLDEVHRLHDAGWRAFKLRAGDSPARDVARVTAVRRAYPDTPLMVDANTLYSLDDARAVMPAYDALGVLWLEEPFAPQQPRMYARARAFGTVPFACGENHFLRSDFHALLEGGAVGHLQPDLSKCGGLTEALQIAALASAHGVPVSPHSATTAINYAASIHYLAAIDTAGWFEGDAASANPLHHEACSAPYALDAQGCVTPLDAPGIGVTVDEAQVRRHRLAD